MTISRQVRRQQKREAAKVDRADTKNQERIMARRERLQRQTAREKSGFYDGTPAVASMVTPSRSRVTTRRVQKGKLEGRILRTKSAYGREFQFHATKGWRSYRAA